jgi:hypothetical protein
VAEYPSIIAGISGAPIEDIKISDVYLQQRGGAPSSWASIQPPESSAAYPEASMFGFLPATGFFLRHAKNLEFTNTEIATAKPDSRPAFWAEDVDGLDLFRIRVAPGNVSCALRNVQDFRSFGSQKLQDRRIEMAVHEEF